MERNKSFVEDLHLREMPIIGPFEYRGLPFRYRFAEAATFLLPIAEMIYRHTTNQEAPTNYVEMATRYMIAGYCVGSFLDIGRTMFRMSKRSIRGEI